MKNEYLFIADKIEVRSLKDGSSPRYVVRGQAIASGVQDIYRYQKNPDGSIRTFSSMFTPHCIQSIKEQSKHKKLFVDGMHELALNTNLKSMLKGKLSPEEEKQMDSMLKAKMLPLAKLNDIEINDNALDVDTELNPMFKTLDDDHKRYFDAVWYSLEKKYLNGISVNFANPKVVNDENGNVVIDDIDVLGFSYVDSPAHHGNSIMEVAIRATQEGGKMNEEDGKKIAEEKAKLEADRKALEEEKAKIAREKADIEAEKKAKEEADKKSEIEKQKEEQARIKAELEKKSEELKKKEEEIKSKEDAMNSAKGTVPPTDKYGQPTQPKYDEQFYKENVAKITAGHDATMKVIKDGKSPMIDRRMEGFAEMVNLQAKISNPTAGMEFEHPEDEALARGLLKKDGKDIVVKR